MQNITEIKFLRHHRRNLRFFYMRDFDKIYKYIYNLLVEANIKKDKELLEQALNELRGMRDTWKEVMAKAKQG